MAPNPSSLISRHTPRPTLPLVDRAREAPSFYYLNRENAEHSNLILFADSASQKTWLIRLPLQSYVSLAFKVAAARRLNSIRCSSDSNSSAQNLNQNGWISTPLPAPQRESDGVEVRVASVPESAGEASQSEGLTDKLVLGSLFRLWYLFNIYFNIYNKQLLVQFVVGSVVVALMWTLNLYKRPKISDAQLAAILPLAVVHTLGNLFTNMSLGKVAVSFTHTIKAMEPFFSVVLSAIFLGEFPTLWVMSSLVPIVGRVALASMTEPSFNCDGLHLTPYGNAVVHQELVRVASEAWFSAAQLRYDFPHLSEIDGKSREGLPDTMSSSTTINFSR